ncbi:MAG: RNA methyltransferase [bacterium]
MSGTDRSATPILGGPTIVLVGAQLGENIGFAARAMLNCGLTELRLVGPRDGWPNPSAVAAAAGAQEVLDSVRVFESTREAIADLGHVYATTARRRDLEKHVVTPRLAAGEMRAQVRSGERVGVLFGAERSGLDNADAALADTLLTVPLNPAFSSLNLGQSVLAVAYEWYQSGDETPPQVRTETREPLAAKGELDALFRHLEQELNAADFFKVPGGRTSTFRGLCIALQRAELTELEVRTLHGVITALSGRRLGGTLRGARRGQSEPSDDG